MRSNRWDSTRSSFGLVSQAPYEFFQTKGGELVTRNGVHYGVRVGSQTFDAFNPGGVANDIYLQQFVFRAQPAIEVLETLP